MTLQPIIDYSGYEHCLGAVPTFVHPNGNLYLVACEKHSGIYQDFSIYRMRPGIVKWELVKRYEGGKDAVSQFTQGGAIIDPYGALIPATACVPKNDPTRTKTGFQNMWDWIPGIDEPYLTDPALDELHAEVAALRAENAVLQARVDALEGSTGGLDTGDREALDRLKVLAGIA